MKYIKLLYLCLCLSLLCGCFDDKGNYDYKELNPPTWFEKFNEISPKNITGYAGQGEMMEFKGSSMFTWDTADSVARSQEVDYEWKIGDVVIGNELDMNIPTEEVVKKIGLQQYSGNMGLWGTFSIIEKDTRVSFPAKILVWIYPMFSPDSWFILSESNGGTKLSSIRERSVLEQGKTERVFELKDNIYESLYGEKIPGRPIGLSMETSRDISPSGAFVVITDQVAYEFNTQSMEKVGEVKDQFMDGTPANFVLSDMKEKAPGDYQEGPSTFLATKDGRVFSRIKSENYLGGEYLTEPYYLDEKGYKITKFGHSQYGSMIPCYDEKNRRIVIATSFREDINHGGGMGDVTSVFKTRMIPVKTHYAAPVSNFPEGTEVLFVTSKNHISWGYGGTTCLFTVYYNDPAGGGTLIGDFSFDNRSGSITYFGLERWMRLPVRLDASSVILVSANNRSKTYSPYAEEAKYRDFYTVGGKLYYLQRGKEYYDTSTKRIVEFNASFASKITCLAYAYYDLDYLWVGCEDGSLYGYDIRNMENPKLVFEKKLDGKIVSLKQIGIHTSSHDWY